MLNILIKIICCNFFFARLAQHVLIIILYTCQILLKMSDFTEWKCQKLTIPTRFEPVTSWAMLLGTKAFRKIVGFSQIFYSDKSWTHLDQNGLIFPKRILFCESKYVGQVTVLFCIVEKNEIKKGYFYVVK